MATLRDELITESTALLSITGNIQGFLKERLSERSYLLETESFFAYINGTLKTVQGHVEGVVANSSAVGPTLLMASLRDFKALELVVGHIYQLVRQVCDADTLSIPFPIISYINELTKCFASTTGARNARMLLLATDELNFLHRRLDMLRQVCQQCKIVPPFPADIGIIAFPYTERNSICLNSLLFHELGHFIFQKAKVADRLVSALTGLDAKLGALPVKGLFDLPLVQEMARQRILFWSEETFADLMGTGLVGPAFAVAFGRLVTLKGTNAGADIRFSDRHPADRFRKTQIAKMLERRGWLNGIETSDSVKANAELVASLRSDAAGAPAYQYLVGNPSLSKVMIDEFQTLVPDIEYAVDEILTHLPNQLDDFTNHYVSVTKALVHMAAPNITYDSQLGAAAPSCVTILICGSLLLRQEMQDVFKLCRRDPTRIRDRLWIEDRINRLVMKGMEDVLVLERWASV